MDRQARTRGQGFRATFTPAIQQTTRDLLLGRCDESACRAALGQQEASLSLLCRPSLSHNCRSGCEFSSEPMAVSTSSLSLVSCLRCRNGVSGETIQPETRHCTSSAQRHPATASKVVLWGRAQARDGQQSTQIERAIALLVVTGAGKLDLETICGRLLVMIAFPWTGANQCLVSHHSAITELRFTAWCR